MRGLSLARRLSIAMALCCGAAVWAQAPVGHGVSQIQGVQQYSGPVGSVSGTVIDQDTQRPLRLAVVRLQAVQTADTVHDAGVGFFTGSRGGETYGHTGVDGTFLMDAVAPGNYYVVASAPGYISERKLLQAQFDAGTSATDLVRQIPTVSVSAGGNATVTVSLQHGAVIGGHVQWQDGSPVTGVPMIVEPAAKPQEMPAPLNTLPNDGTGNQAMLDDRGNFRMAGLARDDYYVLAMIKVWAANTKYASFPPTIGIYAPGTFRKTDAKPVSVGAGDDREDLQLVVDLSSLRTVSGHIGSPTSGVSVKSGIVFLSDSVDSSLRVTGTIDANGDFSVKYVPPGNYTMMVHGSSQERSSIGRRGGSSSEPSVAFQPYTQTLTVGDTDVTGVAINLTASSH